MQRPRDMRADVVIVHYGGPQLTDQCVESLLGQTIAVNEIVVVDNRSGLADSFSAKTRWKNVRVLSNESNRGYAAALNQGVRATNGDIVVCANNDLRFDAQGLAGNLAVFDRQPPCGIIASKVRYMDEPEVINSAGCLVYPDLTGVNRGLDEVDKGQYDVCEEAFAAYGAVMAIRRSVFDRAGFFEEDYFLFMEEDEFAWRMRLKGFTVWFAPDAVVYHKRSANTVLFSPLKLFYSERNRMWNLVKFFPWWYWGVAAVASLRRYLLNAGMMSGTTAARTKKAAALKGRRKGPIVWTLVKAYLAAVKGLPRILRRKRLINRDACMTYAQRIALIRRYAATASDLMK